MSRQAGFGVRNDNQMIERRVVRTSCGSAAHFQDVTRRATRFARRLLAQQGHRRAIENMGRTAAGRARRTENSWPIETSARCLGARLDYIKNWTSATTFAATNDCKINRFNARNLQHHAAQFVLSDNENSSFQARVRAGSHFSNRV